MFSVAIDGPAGAGKSTIAKALAQKLGFLYVDTGALYRTIAVHLIKNNIDPKDTENVEKSLSRIDVAMKHLSDGQHVFLCGEDVTDKIRTPEVSMVASTSSAIPKVRDFLFKLQTTMAKKYNVIMDGRDIGTVVLPNAQIKVFLTASAQERAKRRFIDLEQKGIKETYENVLNEIEKRDAQDINRSISPTKPAEDAVTIDTSNLSFEEVLDKMVTLVKENGDYCDER